MFRKAESGFSGRCKMLTASLALLFPLVTISLGSAEDLTVPQNNPPSNEEFLRGTIRSLLQESLGDLPNDPSDLLLLKAEEDRPENWLVEDELLAYLLSSGRQVVLNKPADNRQLPESKLLFYRIIDLKLDYPQTHRRGIWGLRSVTRRAGMVLSFREEDKATGRVLWSHRGELERTDIVHKSQIRSIGNPSYPFLCPSFSSDPLSRYVEPAVVITIVGGLVYLFFANR